MKINFLIETTNFLVECGKTVTDVSWVQFGDGFHCSWEEFVAATNFEYDNGFGGAEIDLRLKIVGLDWWMERGEYDGSEWWEFKAMPTKPIKHRVPEEKDLREYW